MAQDAAVRAVRLRALERLLKDGPRTIESLASELEVHPRTIKRDMVDLQIPPLCVPLAVDDRGRWYIMRWK